MITGGHKWHTGMNVWEISIMPVVMTKWWTVIFYIYMNCDDVSDAAQENDVISLPMNQVILDQLKTGISRRRVGLLSKGPGHSFIWAFLKQKMQSEKLSRPKFTHHENTHCQKSRCSRTRFNGGDQPCREPGGGHLHHQLCHHVILHFHSWIMIIDHSVNIHNQVHHHQLSMCHHESSFIIIMITWNTIVMIVNWRLELLPVGVRHHPLERWSLWCQLWWWWLWQWQLQLTFNHSTAIYNVSE